MWPRLTFYGLLPVGLWGQDAHINFLKDSGGQDAHLNSIFILYLILEESRKGDLIVNMLRKSLSLAFFKNIFTTALITLSDSDWILKFSYFFWQKLNEAALPHRIKMDGPNKKSLTMDPNSSNNNSLSIITLGFWFLPAVPFLPLWLMKGNSRSGAWRLTSLFLQHDAWSTGTYRGAGLWVFLRLLSIILATLNLWLSRRRERSLNNVLVDLKPVAICYCCIRHFFEERIIILLRGRFFEILLQVMVLRRRETGGNSLRTQRVTVSVFRTCTHWQWCIV